MKAPKREREQGDASYPAFAIALPPPCLTGPYRYIVTHHGSSNATQAHACNRRYEDVVVVKWMSSQFHDNGLTMSADLSLFFLLICSLILVQPVTRRGDLVIRKDFACVSV